jgi:hypothetical protein
MREGVNTTKIYFKLICKYHSVSPVQLLHAKKKATAILEVGTYKLNVIYLSFSMYLLTVLYI